MDNVTPIFLSWDQNSSRRERIKGCLSRELHFSYLGDCYRETLNSHLYPRKVILVLELVSFHVLDTSLVTNGHTVYRETTEIDAISARVWALNNTPVFCQVIYDIT